MLTWWLEEYQLANDEWKFDSVPEIMDGKNISDFIDPEIDELLEQLEREEDERIAALEEQLMDVDVCLPQTLRTSAYLS